MPREMFEAAQASQQQQGDSIDNQNVLGSFAAPIARVGEFATGGRLF
jgi:hypothetical protein